MQQQLSACAQLLRAAAAAVENHPPPRANSTICSEPTCERQRLSGVAEGIVCIDHPLHPASTRNGAVRWVLARASAQMTVPWRAVAEGKILAKHPAPPACCTLVVSVCRVEYTEDDPKPQVGPAGGERQQICCSR